MAQPCAHLSRAPIAEAILDFRVEPRADITPGDFDALAQELHQRYPEQSAIVAGELGMLAQAGGAATTWRTEQPDGRLLRSEHATVVQLRRGGFTFSKLRPYTAWEEVTAEALELWVRYAEVARPQRLTRLAVRYINDMTFPMAPAARYLSAPPVVPSPIPPKIGEFFSRVVILDQESNTTAILVQAQGPQPEPDRLRLLLDIDVFHQGQVPMDRESCAARMQSLRELKNAIFFANITEMAKKQFL